MKDDLYYDRSGQPLGMNDWSLSFGAASDRRVAETTLPNGIWISTVYLGLNHNFGDGPPLIFETMVFRSQEDMWDLDMDRYSTEEQAKAGHEAMVAKWQDREVPK